MRFNDKTSSKAKCHLMAGIALAITLTHSIARSHAGIGLEMEVRNLSFTTQGGGDPGYRKDLVRFVYGGDQLRLDVDHRGGASIVEVVTRHFDERGLGSVDLALTRVARVLTLVKLQVGALIPAQGAVTQLNAIPQVAQPNPNPFNVEAAVVGAVQNPAYNLYEIGLPDEDTRATFDHWIYDLHITAGFQLNEIIDVFRVLYNVNVDGQDGVDNHMSSIKRMAYDAAQVSAALINAGGWANEDDVRGYLALLYLNVAAGAKMGGGALTKNQVLILSRVPMRNIYATLDPNDQALLLNRSAAIKTAIINRIFWYDHTFNPPTYPGLMQVNHWGNQHPRDAILANNGGANIDNYFVSHHAFGAMPGDNWQNSRVQFGPGDAVILDSYLASGLGGVPANAVGPGLVGIANAVSQEEIFGGMTETAMDGNLVPCEIRQLPVKRITTTGNLDVRAGSAYLVIAKLIRFTRGGLRTQNERL